MRSLIRIAAAAAMLAGTGAMTPLWAQASLQRDATTCSTETSPADAAVAACTRLIGSGKLSSAQVASIYFWRAVHLNRKGDYVRVIEDASASLKIKPNQIELLNLRGSAFYDRGEYDIAITDFTDALRIGPSAIVFHNRANSYRSKGDYTNAIADYDQAIRLAPQDAAFAYQNRGVSKQSLGDLDGAMADINLAIRSNPRMPSAYMNRSVLWRAKGDYERAIADDDEAIRLVQSGAPVPTLTPPGSLLIKGYVTRGLAYEAKGDFDKARADFNAALGIAAADAASKASLNTARARLAVLSGGDPDAPPTKRADTGDERRIALVIGNGAYTSVNALPNPSNDARTVANSLRQLGFEVSEGIDLDRAAMEKILRTFMRGAVTARVAVIFYAGHGVQIDGKNYLLPVDIRTDTVQALVSGMTDVDLLLAGLDGQIRTNIIILDACRDNPLAQQKTAQAGAGRSVSVRSGLAAPASLGPGATRGAGTLIAFATAPGQVALDGTGTNSPFTAALTRHLGTPGLEVQQMLTRVRAEVVASTASRQVPWSNSALLGEVFLAGKP